jgi:ribose transport system substrate-binding protein
MRLARGTSATVVALCAAASVFAGCGSSDNSDTSTSASAGTSASTSAPASTAAAGSSALADAQKIVDPYLGQPSPIPVDTPLEKKPTGSVVYLNCGLPSCQAVEPALTEAAKSLSLPFSTIGSGLTAQTVSTAFSSALDKKPAGILASAASDPSYYKAQLGALKENNIGFAGLAVTNAPKYDLKTVMGAPVNETMGRVLAAYVYTQEQDKANAVLYNVPAYSFAPYLVNAFKAQFAKLCSGCTLRVVDLPLQGNVPNTVASDLQSHPDTNWAVFIDDGTYIGVPAALKKAGISGVKTMGSFPGPANLEYVKQGQETATLGISGPIIGWMATDLLAREMTGQAVPQSELDELVPSQILTKDDITFDTSQGFVGPSDYAEHFKKLWGVQ